jgi:TonB family protein
MGVSWIRLSCCASLLAGCLTGVQSLHAQQPQPAAGDDAPATPPETAQPTSLEDEHPAPPPGHEAAETPPVALVNTEVPYPSGATGEARVVLEIVVDVDGSVSQVRVLAGSEPFAKQARTAALKWRFDPARRGDLPVAARVLALVEFRQQVPETTEVDTATPAGSPPPQTSGGAAPGPLEVTVHGQRRDLGQTTLSAAEVREVPGSLGDPFRAVETLPGVTPAASGIPYFFIRGAPPNNNGYFLDGVRVPLLFHVGAGPGVIHPALLDRIEFYPGAAPASFGGTAGAVVAAYSRDPAQLAHGEASVRLFDAGALLESPFSSGQGTALVAGRYGYPGPILSAVSDVELSYWDYQSRLTWRTSQHGQVGALYGSAVFGSGWEPAGTPIPQPPRPGLLSPRPASGEALAHRRVSFHSAGVRGAECDAVERAQHLGDELRRPGQSRNGHYHGVQAWRDGAYHHSQHRRGSEILIFVEYLVKVWSLPSETGCDNACNGSAASAGAQSGSPPAGCWCGRRRRAQRSTGR